MRNHESNSDIINRATDSSSLSTRISSNDQAQDLDFIGWIFDNINISEGDKILELCCGTGAQTLEFLQQVGEEGKVVAVDVSAESLNKLEAKVDADTKTRLTTIEADMMEIGSALAAAGLDETRFDTIFCAYGLYYADEPISVLEMMSESLAVGGSLVVVGPFGPNNGPWFSLLSKAGVRLPEPVRHSSSKFMTNKIIPWGAKNYEKLSIETAVNQVIRTSADELFEYWQNTTYFDQECADSVQDTLENHFATNHRFVNFKWIMHLTMRSQRKVDAVSDWEI